MTQNTNELYPSLGSRFSNDLFPERQFRGLRQYPVGGVLAGAVTTASVASSSTLSVTVGTGVLKLDAKVVNIAAPITKVITTAVDLSLPVNQIIQVFVNPTRLYPAQPIAPSSPVNGAKWLQTIEYAEASQIVGYKVYNSTLSLWEDFDPIKERIGYGQMALPFNDVIDSLTAANIVGRAGIEKTVYNGTGVPIYVNTMAPALARNCAAIAVAEVTVNAGAVVKIVTPQAETLIV